MLTYICDKQTYTSSVIPESNLPYISTRDSSHSEHRLPFQEVQVLFIIFFLGVFRSLLIVKISDKSIHSRFALNANYPWLRFLNDIHAVRAGILIRTFWLNIYMNAKQNLKE